MKHVTFLFLLFLFWSSSVIAQESIMTGRITDANDGSGLIGASVLVKGTSVGTISDLDGNFSLEVPSRDATLVFSCIGYKTQEIKLQAGVKLLNVEMNEDVEVLQDVVVIGYGVTKKALLTGANLNVKGDDVAKLNTTSAMEALQGIAPGVTVTRNNGAPGAGTKVTIRGMGTIGNSNPLYVVDGVAVSNIDYLSTNDIESIDILKDAASSAIYGSRAANGVVLVTTKKGKQNSKPTISYDGYFGVQNVYKNVPVLNAQEYMYIMDESRLNDGLAPHDWYAELTNNSWLQGNYQGLGVKLGEDIWNRLQNGWEGTNWVDEMTKEDAPMQNHSLNIVGGAENVTYSFGFSYYDQVGIIGGDLIDAGYRRLTARMNTEVTLIKNSKFDVLKLGENLTYTNTKNKGVATGNIYWNDLHNAMVQSPLMPSYWSQSPDKNGFTPTLEGLANDQHNPLAVMYYGRNYNWGKGNTIVGNVYAELQPIKNLKYRSTFGLNAWFGHSRSWSPTYQLGTQFGNAQDAAEQSMYQGVDYTWTNTVTYHYKREGHTIDLLAGMEMLKTGLNMNVGGRKIGTLFGKPENAYLDNANKTELTGIDTWGKDWGAQGGGLLSYIGRTSYNYMGKYMADATIRRDGSSNFAKGNRWGTFPSFSAGWNFTEETFMENITNVMNYGKLRASWGQNGNQAIDNFIYTSNISYLTQGYFFGDTKPVSGTTGIPANVPNKDVTWETSEQLNFGIDTHFFDSRLAFSFDWYKKVTKDWLVIAPILGTSGAGAPWINGGNIENTGIEFSLGWNDNISDLRYGVTITGAHNKNKVTKLANAEGIMTGPAHVLSQGTSYISRVQVGEPIGYFYGFKADGILQNQKEVDAYVNKDGKPYFADQRPGDVRFVDINQDGVIDDNDKVKLGKPNPDFELGGQINFEYKNFYMNLALSGKFGMQVMRSYRSFADRFDQNYTTEIFGRWHGEGTSNRLPRLSSTSHRNTNYISDIYMYDADYIRINNLTVGYSFDKMLKMLGWVQGAKVYVSFNNLYTFTSYDGMDPDVAFGHDASWASGVDLGLYPLPRTVMFGVNITF